MPPSCGPRCSSATARSSAGCSTSPTTSSTARSCHRPGVVRHDGDDPYLVVAADKGTASFSDVANELAAEYGYWLDDAFASGGSSGYDHKEMGITVARRVDLGACALPGDGRRRRHRRAHGGGHRRHVGRRLRQRAAAVAAPEARGRVRPPARVPRSRSRPRGELPGAAQRLFALPRSSWADYDPAVISAGGGVYPRDAKSIADLRRRRGRVLALDVESADSRRRHLGDPARAGRSPLERRDRHVREGEHRDGRRRRRPRQRRGAHRRDRAAVQGGRRGWEPRAHAGARGSSTRSRGGRIYTDAIDNSAGVDCSDHEVNIKILLARRDRRSGLLAEADRDPLLESMTDEVAALVLADNEAQANALEIAAVEAAELVGVHARQMERLEHDRPARPGARTAARRRRAAGTARRRSRSHRARARGAARVHQARPPARARRVRRPRRPVPRPRAPRLLPDAAARAGSATRLDAHPLRREIIATVVANAVVNRAGISFLSRLADETGHAPPRARPRAHRRPRRLRRRRRAGRRSTTSTSGCRRRRRTGCSSPPAGSSSAAPGGWSGATTPLDARTDRRRRFREPVAAVVARLPRARDRIRRRRDRRAEAEQLAADGVPGRPRRSRSPRPTLHSARS